MPADIGGKCLVAILLRFLFSRARFFFIGNPFSSLR
jgi:hypothetical protein